MADSLTFAVSPVCAVMALLALPHQNAQDLLCAAGSSAPWNGMATMYLLMCAAHLPPWLKILARRRNRVGLFASLRR